MDMELETLSARTISPLTGIVDSQETRARRREKTDS